jgi:hypothetical protein
MLDSGPCGPFARTLIRQRASPIPKGSAAPQLVLTETLPKQNPVERDALPPSLGVKAAAARLAFHLPPEHLLKRLRKVLDRDGTHWLEDFYADNQQQKGFGDE